jgi:hypothetical protein
MKNLSPFKTTTLAVALIMGGVALCGGSVLALGMGAPQLAATGLVGLWFSGPAALASLAMRAISAFGKGWKDKDDFSAIAAGNAVVAVIGAAALMADSDAHRQWTQAENARAASAAAFSKQAAAPATRPAAAPAPIVVTATARADRPASA